MVRILILVEGQTEETFVRDILCPYFLSRDKILIPKIVTTKRLKNGHQFKGGISKYSKIKNDLLRLINDTDAKAITTLLDFYGLPDDFPGKSSIPHGTCFSRVIHLQNEFQKDIGNHRFIPFLALHEFEAYLFTSPSHIADVFPDSDVVNQLEAIANSNTSPEQINEGPETHPSARIEKLIPQYRKTLHGPIIAKRIGLQAIQKKCNHFKTWLDILEAL